MKRFGLAALAAFLLTGCLPSYTYAPATPVAAQRGWEVEVDSKGTTAAESPTTWGSPYTGSGLHVGCKTAQPFMSPGCT